MINITKISNQDDGFILQYWSGNDNKAVIVNKDNITDELNKAFIGIKKIQDERREKEAAYLAQAQHQGYQAGIASNSCLGTNLPADVTIAA